MVNPTEITNYNRSDFDLQEFFIFCICVPGKTASVITKKVDALLAPAKNKSILPLDYIKSQNRVRILKKHKMGRYKAISRALSEVIKQKIDLRTCTVEHLENIYGIGPKTARFFILHSRPNVNVAVLDTHIKGWLEDKGYKAKCSLSRKRYIELETVFLNEAKKLGMTVADLDLSIWNMRSSRSGVKEKANKTLVNV